MEIVKKNTKFEEEWNVGDIFLDDGGDYAMIVYDNSTTKYRLIWLKFGAIYSEEYDTIKELVEDNSKDNSHPLQAELFVSE